jgi:transposase
VPGTHPLRPIRQWINEALAKMDEKFSAMYEADIKGGRPSIAPDKLMRAMLLQVLYSVRSERQLVEHLSYNLLFRWFVGLAIDDTVWNRSVFSKNRDRLIEHDAVTELFNATVEMARKKGLLSGEHFSVDGTLIRAWASHKSMRRKDGSDDGRWPTARELARRETKQRHARVQDRPRVSAVPQEPGCACAAELPRARADGQPSWAGGQRAGEPE